MGTKLYTKIVDRLQTDISSGKYKPGEKIPPEPELMKLYGVGRSTIREAIKTLAMAGILLVQQGSGTSVNTNLEGLSIEQRLRRANVADIQEVRRLLEREIVRLAVEHCAPEQLVVIGEALEGRRQALLAEDLAATMEADIAFHMAIARASGNSVLADLYYHFTLILRDFFNNRSTRGISRFAMNHHLHEALLEAIGQHDAGRAEEALAAIITEGN
jgi:DNA-binding FadR family transcriptional regulator